MTMAQSVFSSITQPPRRMTAIFLLVFLMAFPVRGFAQCEADGVAMARAQAVAGEENAALNTMVKNDEMGWVADLQPLRATLGKMNRDNVMNYLNTFWSRWGGAWRSMSAQLSSGVLDESRQQGSINDASNVLAAALDEQQERVKSTLNNQPTEAACRFDTAAYSLSPAREMTKALQEGYESDFTAFGNNEKAAEQEQSIAQYGPAEMQNQLWNSYVNNFCDYRAENGNAGCGPDPLPPNFVVPPFPDPNLLIFANMDALPSRLLFAQWTLNMYNPTQMLATNQMIFNVTGYKIPAPMPVGALGSVAGVEHTLDRRRYMAQMDTTSALLYSLIADRAPVNPPAEQCTHVDSQTGAVSESCTYALRQYLGVQNFSVPQKWLPPIFMEEASPTPSLREIRQSVVEQLWDPNYYKDLYDNPSSIAQKEVYLKAYGLVMLYDMISKQEKISDAYAVETANILSHSSKSLSSFSQHIPVQ